MHRKNLGIPLGASSIILVRETDEQNHGGLPRQQLLDQCPAQIGCGEHVLKPVTDCPKCRECSIDIQQAVTAHANSAGGVIDWIRFNDFKMISLKQIVQQMMVAAQRADGEHRLCIPGELSTTSLEMPTQPQTRVLLHSGCHLSKDMSDELPRLLAELVPSMVVQLMDGDQAGAEVPLLLADAAAQTDERAEVATRLLVVVHDKCFENASVVRSLTFALTNKIPVVLVHEADADFGGCTFGSIINQCQPELKQIAGFDGMKLFGPIAVQWSRGQHQPVSIRLLAMSLGATAAQQQRLCHSGIAACCRQMAGAFAERHARSKQIPTELETRSGKDSGIELGTIASDEAVAVGWHHGIESTTTGEAVTQAILTTHFTPTTIETDLETDAYS
jgi:hypothetical protein